MSNCTKGPKGGPCYDDDISCRECWGNWVDDVRVQAENNVMYIKRSGLFRCCFLHLLRYIRDEQKGKMPLNGHRTQCTSCLCHISYKNNTWAYDVELNR